MKFDPCDSFDLVHCCSIFSKFPAQRFERAASFGPNFARAAIRVPKQQSPSGAVDCHSSPPCNPLNASGAESQWAHARPPAQRTVRRANEDSVLREVEQYGLRPRVGHALTPGRSRGRCPGIDCRSRTGPLRLYSQTLRRLWCNRLGRIRPGVSLRPQRLRRQS
jgi:hypothetical protein